MPHLRVQLERGECLLEFPPAEHTFHEARKEFRGWMLREHPGKVIAGRDTEALKSGTDRRQVGGIVAQCHSDILKLEASRLQVENSAGISHPLPAPSTVA